jgi:NIMA-interacting peptidyl-prolyl cis-trans isomerase 4
MKWKQCCDQTLIILLSFAARHILCEKQGKIQEAYKKLQEGWLNAGDKVPPAEFGKVRDREYKQLASAMFG